VNPLEDKKSPRAQDVAVFAIPETLCERRMLVDFAEWISTHYPWRLALHTRAKQRINERVA